MMFPRLAPLGNRLFIGLCLIAFLSAPSAIAIGGDNWKPIDPAHLAMKAPVVDKDADAEVIFWEVRVTHEDKGTDLGTVLDHYVRIKIFTERGRESQSRVDIFAPRIGNRGIKIKDIAGRTIKADGQIVELKKEDVFERDVVKASGLKVKAKTFAMPAVEPGAIIEYRWREVRDGITSHERFDFSREIPVQFIKYYIKAASGGLVDSEGRPVGMRAQTFFGSMTPFQKESGFYTTTMSNIPPFREEPRMPPEYAVRPWMLVYYSPERASTTLEKFWRDYGKVVYEEHKSQMKVNEDIKKAAAEAIAGANTDEE